MSAKQQTLLEFPCRFPIKAMGRADSDLPATVERLVRRHTPDLTGADLHSSQSRNGNYLAVTATITATSREQLDAIYRALSADPAIIMAL